MTKREAAAIRVVQVINSCNTTTHIGVARVMIQRFVALYDDTLPLQRFLMQRAFEINAIENLKTRFI